MPIQLNSRPLADFNRPVDMMEDCHRRIEHFLLVTQRVLETVRVDQPLDSEPAAALRVALDYFLSAAPKHTADEEVSLFPRMRASTDSRIQAALQQLAELEHDHDVADALHATVESLGRVWLDAAAVTAEDVARVTSAVDELVSIYRRHIAIEDEQVFPLARQVLDAKSLVVVGREMRDRRGGSCSERKQAAQGATDVP